MMSSFSCKPLIVVSCVLQVSLHSTSGDGWLRLRRSPDTTLMSHSSYSTPALSPSAATPWRLIDDLHLRRTLLTHLRPNMHIVTYFQVLWCLRLSIRSRLKSFLFIASSICLLGLERYFYAASAQIKQEFCKASGDRVKGQGRRRVRPFFPPNRTHQHTNQILLPPLALWHCGSEWSKKVRLQLRAYCRLIRAFWAERPLLPPPWEAPNTTACGVNGGPSWELWQMC